MSDALLREALLHWSPMSDVRGVGLGFDSVGMRVSPPFWDKRWLLRGLYAQLSATGLSETGYRYSC